MEISDEFKKRILGEIDTWKSHLISKIPGLLEKCTHSYAEIPIILFMGAPVDLIRFNVSEKRFDQIRISVTIEDVVPVDWFETGESRTAYCSKSRTVTIPLPLDYCWNNNSLQK